jgi:hypothetical protein
MTLSGRSAPILGAILLTFTCTSANARDWYLSAGQLLQPVLDQAALGDTITLAAGASFRGAHILKKKSGTGWITIQSSAISMLQPDRRVSPADRIHMPKIIADNAYPAIAAEDGAHHYRIIGVELASAQGVYNWQVVQLGAGDETSLDRLPAYIEFDRVYIHGDPTLGGKRGITMNSRYTTVKNSYLADFKSTWQDSQAIAGWNGAGPFTIENNYLEAAGENVNFGGSKPAIPNLVPSDITLRRNHLYKPLSWKRNHPSYSGTAWWIKNIFELKNARRVLLEGNVFENAWQDRQKGYALVLIPRTSNNLIPWTIIENITIRNNIFKHCAGGITIGGRDDANGPGMGRNFQIENNLFEDIDHLEWGNSGIAFLLLNGPQNVTIDHNTIFQSGRIVHFEGSPDAAGFVYRNNIAPHNAYGIFGSSAQPGNVALNMYAPNAYVRYNVIAGGNAALYPTGNYFPGSLATVGFVNMTAGEYGLTSTSPYRAKGSDGKDIGVDMAAVRAATAGVVQR